MALVICPDCGHEISEYANMCPNCGFPLQKFLKENNFTNIQGVLVCPKCASVYTVEEARGKAFQKGEKLSIGNFDLKSLKEFKSEV